MPENDTELLCCLCQLQLPSHPILDGALRFCCSGCQAVFSILSVRGESGNYQTHPLFAQALRFGLISNPVLLEQMRLKSEALPDQEFLKVHFEIYEMWCPSCAEVIRLVLLQEKGVKSCLVDYATDLAMVEFAPRHISKEQIFDLIKALGYQPYLFAHEGDRKVSRMLYVRFIVAAFCALNVMMFAYPLYATYFDFSQEGVGRLFAWLSFAVSLPVVTYCAWPIFRRFLSTFSVGIFGMEALVVLGVGAAMGLSTYELIQGGTQVYFDSMCVIITFILLGKIIESKAKFSAKESLLRLNRSLPKRCRKCLPSGGHAYVLLKDLNIGDLIQVRMGETVVLDGVVIEGEGCCNESLMTGEPLPLFKSVGSKVLGGSLLQQGNLVIKITAAEGESTLHRIVELIEQDMARKSSYVRAADVLVRWFVPLVLTIAVLTAIYAWLFGASEAGERSIENAVLRAVTVLLISCPCALGIAAPLAESYLINALTRLGAIVRNRAALQYLGLESWMVFDKTGTMTEGRFEVLSGLEKFSGHDLGLLRGMVSRSNHPISVAIAVSLKAPEAQFDKVEEVAGKGLKGEIFGQLYLLGSAQFLMDHGIALTEEDGGGLHLMETLVYFVKKGDLPIKLTLGDCLRPGAESIIEMIKPVKTLLLSGDGRSCVKFVADKCGFTEFLSQATPLDKREKIQLLKQSGAVISMVGDGINDAPALTAAHVGISVVTATDISIQVSDILLTNDKLEVIAKIRHLASQGRCIIRQNLFWAFFYNVIGIGLAVSGVLTPIFAAFAMVASSLIVLFNSQRLK